MYCRVRNPAPVFLFFCTHTRYILSGTVLHSFPPPLVRLGEFRTTSSLDRNGMLLYSTVQYYTVVLTHRSAVLDTQHGTAQHVSTKFRNGKLQNAHNLTTRNLNIKPDYAPLFAECTCTSSRLPRKVGEKQVLPPFDFGGRPLFLPLTCSRPGLIRDTDHVILPRRRCCTVLYCNVPISSCRVQYGTYICNLTTVLHGATIVNTVCTGHTVHRNYH